MDEVEFQLIAKSELARDLGTAIGSEAKVRIETATAPKELQLSPLEASAAVMTIIVGGAELAALCVKLVRFVREWRRKKAAGPGVKLLIRGARDDVLIEVGEESDDAKIAESIRLTLTRP